jgi:diacylglycerol kinase (ATP)
MGGNEPFIKGRIKGMGYAIKGAWLLLRNEASIQVQVVIAIIITATGFYFDISPAEWILQTLTIALVLGIEGLNTAIEELADFVQPEQDPRIGYVKDIGAGAVFFAAVAAVIVACMIYVPKFQDLFSNL